MKISVVKKLSAICKAAPAGLALACLGPSTAWACAACYGQSDSPLAQGMTWAVFSLLGIVVFVLGGIAAFFIFLARRSAVQQQSPGIGGEPLLANPHPPVTDYR